MRVTPLLNFQPKVFEFRGGVGVFLALSSAAGGFDPCGESIDFVKVSFGDFGDFVEAIRGDARLVDGGGSRADQ